MNASYRRYRVMSYVTGTTLLMLCATFVLHKVSASTWESISWFVKLIGIGHGVVLYPLYMIASFQMVLKNKLSMLLLVGMLLAGFVPGLAFYLEHRMRIRLFSERGEKALS
jgi:integral membrane protein